jgi:hypothetical protein
MRATKAFIGIVFLIRSHSSGVGSLPTRRIHVFPNMLDEYHSILNTTAAIAANRIGKNVTVYIQVKK